MSNRRSKLRSEKSSVWLWDLDKKRQRSKLGAQGVALPQDAAGTSERRSPPPEENALCAGEILTPINVIRMQCKDLRSKAATACPLRNWTLSNTIQSLHRA